MPPETVLWVSVAAFVALAVGFAISSFLNRRHGEANLNSAENRAGNASHRLKRRLRLLSKMRNSRPRMSSLSAVKRLLAKPNRPNSNSASRSGGWKSREDSLEQSIQAHLKKERLLQHTERKLHERREQLEKKLKEVEAQLAEHQHKLHEISGLSREQAKALLLEPRWTANWLTK